MLLQVYLLQVMYMAFHYLTVLCIRATEHVYGISLPDIYLGLYLAFLCMLSGYDIFPGIFLVAILWF